MSSLVKMALAVARKYPVFPTTDKKPTWSNNALGVAKGEGGYKIATQDPDKVVELFSHERATEIAVPMGEMSGLMCIDVDVYKDPGLQDWIDKNAKDLDTLAHSTRSGGMHFIFKHPGDTIRFPATLRPGVDIKAAGNGYICWPGTAGYRRAGSRTQPRSFPMRLLEESMKAKGGTGSYTVGSAFNDATDDELIACIIQAEELYPALRSLSFRMPSRRDENGKSLSEQQQIDILKNIMAQSVAAAPSHPRHQDWVDRLSKIPDLVESARRKHSAPLMDAESARIFAESQSFIDTQKMIAQASRPIGPQRETTAKDIERLVEDIDLDDGVFETVSAQSLLKETLPSIEWIVPGMVPRRGVVSLGGTSNVGKTRWLAAFAVLGAAGRLPEMGLPAADKISTLWIANEERVDDIKRRIKSTVRQHSLKSSLDISIRGKDKGMLRLVAVNESGNPEIDEKNVAILVAEAKRISAAVIYFDPYITLSDAMDENSSASAAVLTKAFILVITLTGCAIIHAHHTPKDRSKDEDWYRGDASAWRGSSAIYSALDCGYTLSHWMPKGKEPRRAWKQHYLDQKLSRWIVLDTGKIREGEPLDPIIYELVGQDMDDDEGEQIGVCRLATDAEANNVLINSATSFLASTPLALALIKTMGYGVHSNMSKLHRDMKGQREWMIDTTRTPGKDRLHSMFKNIFHTKLGSVQLIVIPAAKDRWDLVIAEPDSLID